ncbi:MAG: hypothetical protein LBQ16_06170, partial [Gracilibacteraceae bacterium]|nr:hypothetical protein [Gracilibacteraceae bacterium]
MNNASACDILTLKKKEVGLLTRYAEVLLDVANRRLDDSFHYIVPEGMSVRAGAIVQVPLKNRQVRGLVAALTDELPADVDFALRPLSAVLEEDSLIPPDILALAAWLAETTVCPMARSLHTVWPFLRGKGETWYIPAGAWAEPGDAAEETDERRARTRQCLKRSRRGGLPGRDLMSRAGVSEFFLRECEAAGLLRRETRFRHSRGGAPAPAGAAGSAAGRPAGAQAGPSGPEAGGPGEQPG